MPDPGPLTNDVHALLATWFGAGHLPVAPATWGSLAALPLAALFAWLGGPWLLLVATALVFAAGLWVVGPYMAALGVHDPGSVVIDEVAGQWLTLAFVPLDPLAYVAGFVLFRAFDVVKPWPVYLIDQHVTGAFGVMLDDLAAAVYAAVILWLITRWLQL